MTAAAQLRDDMRVHNAEAPASVLRVSVRIPSLHVHPAVPSRERPMKHARLTLSAAAVALAVGIAPVARAQSSTLALGIDTTNFDRSVRPQDDFFRFVNGGW